MKKLISLGLTALSAVCWAQSPADDAVLKNTIEARGQSAEALRMYNDAVQANVNAGVVLNGRLENLNQIRAQLAQRRQSQQQAQAALENLADRYDILKAQFGQNCDFLDMAGKSMQALSQYLPVGEARIRAATEAAREGMKLANLNPGERFEDRNYFSWVVANFGTATQQLKQVQQDAEKFGISLAIAAPRIEGVRQTLKLYDDFSGKAADSAKANAGKLDKAAEQVLALSEAYLKTFDELAASRAALRAERVKMLGSALSVQALVLNDLAGNEKYRNAVFPPLGLDDLAQFAVYGQTAGKHFFEKSPVGSLYASPSAAPVRSKGATADAQLNRAMMEDSGAESAAMSAEGTPVAPKTARAEVLEKANTLIDVTAELNRTTRLIADILADARSAMDAIERDEGQSQQLLREGMGVFTQAQSLSADLEIFNNTACVAKTQGEVSAIEFAKLAEQSKRLLEACAKARGKADAACEAARKALK